MSIAVKNIFGSVAAGALLLSVSAAIAQGAPANQSVAKPSSEPVAFATFNDTDRSVNFVKEGAAAASSDKIAIVVFSGNRKLQREAYQAALQLRDDGLPLALILGPSLDPSNSSAAIQVYARSVPVYEGYGAIIGEDNIDYLRAEMIRAARSAYERHFPERYRALMER